MKTYEYKTKGICAQKITFTLDGNTVSDVKFHGGCNGNGTGIANLLEGTDAREAAERLKNVNCQNRGTSCPAQLAIALREAMEE